MFVLPVGRAQSTAIVGPRPDGGIHASDFGAVALAWLLQRSPNILLIPGTSSTSHLQRGRHEEFLERPVPSFIVNTGQLAPHTIAWALTQGM